MITEFLLAQWKYVLIAVLIALLGASTKLYFNKVHEYESFKAQVVAATEVIKAQQEKVEQTNKEFVATKETEHAKELADLDSTWRAELTGLRKHASGGGTAKPVQIVTNVCDNAAANAGLSDAVQRFEQRLDDAIASYQDGVGGLLENADKDSATLYKINEWAAGERLINQ